MNIVTIQDTSEKIRTNLALQANWKN